jgi:hypothetical protein
MSSKRSGKRRATELAAAVLCAAAFLSPVLSALRADVLQSVDAIPAHLAGRFRDPAGFQRAASGQYFVFDRRSQIVFGVDDARSSAWEIVHIGSEPGRIINPVAFAVDRSGTFVVADSPNNQERIQVFTPAGFRIGGFLLPGRVRARVVLDGLALNGIGSLQFTGTSVLLSQPDTGMLITEYSLDGTPLRSFGELRRTGHEGDEALHVALNAGLPVIDPRGGFFFVFQTGEPMFRKYDAGGKLVFERRIQGREIDELVARLPTQWPRRRPDSGELPYATPTIRTAAADEHGLWVSFSEPYTYVFDGDGDKIRTVQFRAAGIVSPNHLFFDGAGHLLVTPGLYIFDAGVGSHFQ